jgi:hypothetical protein
VTEIPGFLLESWRHGLAALPLHLPYLGNRWVECALLSALFGLGFAALMRGTGLFRFAERAGRGVLGAAHEVLLFRWRPRAVLRAEGRLLRSLEAVLLALVPVLLVGAPLILGFASLLKERYGHAPARIERSLVVRIEHPRSGAREEAPWPRRIEKLEGLSLTARVEPEWARRSWLRLEPGEPGTYPLAVARKAQPVRLRAGADAGSVQRWWRVGGSLIFLNYPHRRWESVPGGLLAYAAALALIGALAGHTMASRIGQRLRWRRFLREARAAPVGSPA